MAGLDSSAPVYLSAKQLSERWGGLVVPETLDTWRSRGKGPKFTRIGGRVAYHLKDIEAYEEEQRRQSTRGGRV